MGLIFRINQRDKRTLLGIIETLFFPLANLRVMVIRKRSIKTTEPWVRVDGVNIIRHLGTLTFSCNNRGKGDRFRWVEPPSAIPSRIEHRLPWRISGEPSFWKASDKNFCAFLPFLLFLFQYLTLHKAACREKKHPERVRGWDSPGLFREDFNPLALHHIDSLQALLSLGDFELHFISLSKNLETILFNGRKVHK